MYDKWPEKDRQAWMDKDIDDWTQQDWADWDNFHRNITDDWEQLDDVPDEELDELGIILKELDLKTTAGAAENVDLFHYLTKRFIWEFEYKSNLRPITLQEEYDRDCWAAGVLYSNNNYSKEIDDIMEWDLWETYQKK